MKDHTQNIEAKTETQAAFELLKQAINSEPSYAWSWHCNIAVSAFDEGVDHAVANRAASRFMKLCFDVDTSESEHFRSLGIPPPQPRPVDMILFCPNCWEQHIDAEEDETAFQDRMAVFILDAEPQDRFPTRWTNPPHRSHLCHKCGCVWRPSDTPTNGVATISTQGERDSWTPCYPTPQPIKPVEVLQRIADIFAGLPRVRQHCGDAYVTPERALLLVAESYGVSAAKFCHGYGEPHIWFIEKGRFSETLAQSCREHPERRARDRRRS